MSHSLSGGAATNVDYFAENQSGGTVVPGEILALNAREDSGYLAVDVPDGTTAGDDNLIYGCVVAPSGTVHQVGDNIRLRTIGPVPELLVDGSVGGGISDGSPLMLNIAGPSNRLVVSNAAAPPTTAAHLLSVHRTIAHAQAATTSATGNVAAVMTGRV